jgi:ABC-type nitrate/sulfonate/bicarbonate transport system permease component
VTTPSGASPSSRCEAGPRRRAAHEAIGAVLGIVLGISFFVLFVAVWAAATLGGFVSKTFLADPMTMVKSGWTLLTEMGFAGTSA